MQCEYICRSEIHCCTKKSMSYSLSARIPHHESEDSSGSKFSGSKIVPVPRIRSHLNSFRIWKVAEALLGKECH